MLPVIMSQVAGGGKRLWEKTAREKIGTCSFSFGLVLDFVAKSRKQKRRKEDRAVERNSLNNPKVIGNL